MLNQPVETQENKASKIVDLEHLPSMEDLMAESESEKFAVGTVTTGKVVDKKENSIVVDIGYKAEGIVDRDEVNNFQALEVGQEIDVFIEILEDEDHETPLLSVRKAEGIKSWNHIVENYQEGDVIRGTVQRRVKGGLIVDVGGVEAFLPGSQVDVGPVHNLEDYLEQELDFKLVKISRERRNVVVSRRELIEEARAEQRAALLNELQIGDLRKGVVKNITDFGAFVDLDGMDGLLHITDMSWGRIGHPSEMLEIGDEVEVMVLDIDYEKLRVSLGLKQKEGNPWEKIEEKYPPGSRVQGRVVNLMPYGAFVELEEGIEGLIHVSEMSWTKRITKASDILSLGDEVEAVVLEVQKENRKVSLGLRQLTENPWETLAEQFPQGSKVKGRVRNMTAYGAFVQIQDDIDGMIHVSDMSWTRKINHPGEMLEKGQEVEAVILGIDPEQQRISLGLKQLEEDPWIRIGEYYNVGDVVEGEVAKIASFGAFVELANGVEGLIHISQLSEDHVKKVGDVLSIGDKVTARVVKVDPEERRLGLSVREAPETSQEDGTGQAAPASELKPGQDIGAFGHMFESVYSQENETEPQDSASPSEKTEAGETESEEAQAEETGDIEPQEAESQADATETGEAEAEAEEKEAESQADATEAGEKETEAGAEEKEAESQADATETGEKESEATDAAEVQTDETEETGSGESTTDEEEAGSA